MLELKFKPVEEKRDERIPKTKNATDIIDFLHYRVTSFCLFFCALASASFYFGNFIDCILPKEVEDAQGWSMFFLTYCFVRGTYKFYGKHYDNNLQHEFKESDFVTYYQWVPIFYLFQSICFLLPVMLWFNIQRYFFVDISALSTDAHAITLLDSTNKEEKEYLSRKQKVNRVAEYLFRYLKYLRFGQHGMFGSLFKQKYSVTVWYLLYKLINLTHTLGQLYLICRIIETDFFWGIEEIKNYFIRPDPVYSNSQETLVPFYKSMLFNFSSTHFPTIVQCNLFTMSQMDVPLHHNSVQCLLPTNYINEKIFFILYWWYLILATLVFTDILFYIFGFLTGQYRGVVVDTILSAEDCSITRANRRGNAGKFVEEFLGPDGILLLHFIRMNSSASAYHEVTARVYELYDEKGHSKQVFANDDNP